MFESMMNFFKRFGKNEKESSKVAAKERLHLVLAQDRANISADFLEMMKQEIIEVIKKYIDIDEGAIDVRMTNKPGEDGTIGAPALYANIPIVTIKNDARKLEGMAEKKEIIENNADTEDADKLEEKDNKEIEDKVLEQEDKNENKEKIQDNKKDIEPIEEKSKAEDIEKNEGEEQTTTEKVEEEMIENNAIEEKQEKMKEKDDKKITSNHNNHKKKK